MGGNQNGNIGTPFNKTPKTLNSKLKKYVFRDTSPYMTDPTYFHNGAGGYASQNGNIGIPVKTTPKTAKLVFLYMIQMHFAPHNISEINSSWGGVYADQKHRYSYENDT